MFKMKLYLPDFKEAVGDAFAYVEANIDSLDFVVNKNGECAYMEREFADDFRWFKEQWEGGNDMNGIFWDEIYVSHQDVNHLFENLIIIDEHTLRDIAMRMFEGAEIEFID